MEDAEDILESEEANEVTGSSSTEENIYSDFIIIRHNLSSHMFPSIMWIIWPNSKIFFPNTVLLTYLLTYLLAYSVEHRNESIFSQSRNLPNFMETEV